MLSGLVLLWITTLTTSLFEDRLDQRVMGGIVLCGTQLTALSRFSLPLAWKFILTRATHEANEATAASPEDKNSAACPFCTSIKDSQ